DADRVPVDSESWRATACPRLGSGADGPKRHGIWRIETDAGKLTNLGKSQKIAHRRLATAIFIGAIGMQPIPATAAIGIDERDRQVVAAEKPGEDPGCGGLPSGIVVRTQSGQAGGNRGGCFHRLLV